jgi:arylsulfatase A-like enzyme
MIDIAPTFLSVAGVTPGPTFQGVSFLPILKDPESKIREVVFAEQNWHDYEAHSRAARTEEFKYIRNSYPDLPLTPSADGVRSPSFQQMISLHEQGKLPAIRSVYFLNPRPREELYHPESDPHELKNLIQDPAYRKVLSELRGALDHWVSETNDRTPKLRTADEFDRKTGLPTPARVRPRLSKKEMIKKGLTAP